MPYHHQTLILVYCVINLKNTVTMHNFEQLKVVGDGSFSVVYQARRKVDGQLYAIKKVKMSCLAQQQKISCLNEIWLLARLTHPNIIQYREAFFEGEHLCLVTEFAEGGDFLQLMMQRRRAKRPFTQQQFCGFARQMANGLSGLHRTSILHRDVKAANFFMVGDRIKIGDMNVSSISKDGMASTKIGTPYYTSPQIWEERPYSFKSDIWSLGCLFYQMVTFLHPFSGRDVAQLKSNILETDYHPLPSETPQQISNLIEMCLQKDAALRPSADQLLSNEYLRRKYNQFKQKTMEKSMMNPKDYQQVCRRILKEINHSAVQPTKPQLPRSNYFTVQKQQKSLQKKKGRSTGKKLPKRLLTMFNIYNQRPASLAKRSNRLLLMR